MNMKTVKNYKSFSDQYRLNENLLTKAWGKVWKFFKKKFKTLGWLYYAMFLKKTGQLPKDKVRLYVPKSILSKLDDVPTEKELKNEAELSLESMDLSNLQVGSFEINEDSVPLEHPDPKMHNVDVEGLKEKINRVFKMNMRRVEKGQKRTKQHAVFIWGAPGIGKTEILNQVAEENGAVVIEWLLSQIDPTDFRGVPKVEDVVGKGRKEDERTVNKLPKTFPDQDTEVPGIMFFDEMNQAADIVLGAALSLVLNGKMGDYTLPEKWIVVAAGNRGIDLPTAPPTEMSSALANRFAHINYAPTVDAWVNWALKQEEVNPDLIAFLMSKKEFFHKLEGEADVDQGSAWPSPRAWHLASDEEYAERGYSWENTRVSKSQFDGIYIPRVGAQAAAAFGSYLALKLVYNDQAVESVFKQGKKGKRLPRKADEAYAATASIASYKAGKKWDGKEVKNLTEFLLSLPNIEQRTPILSMAKEYHPEVKTDPILSKIWWNGIRSWHTDMKDMDKNIR